MIQYLPEEFQPGVRYQYDFINSIMEKDVWDIYKDIAKDSLVFIILDDLNTLLDGEFTWEDVEIIATSSNPFTKYIYKSGKAVFKLLKGSKKGKGNVERKTIKSSKGNEIDITPSAKHTTTKNPGLYGEPNSSVDIIDPKSGEIKTRRYFGPDGKATRDVDMTNHGNPKRHPEVTT